MSKKRQVQFREPEPPSKKAKFEAPQSVTPAKGPALSIEEYASLTPDEIIALRKFKKEQTDDMSLLAHLDSAKSKLFENYNYDQDRVDNDDEFTSFSSIKKASKSCYIDPMKKFKYKQKEEEKDNKNFWYDEWEAEQQLQKIHGNDEEVFNKLEKKPARKNDKRESYNENLDNVNFADLLRKITDVLEDGETVTSALRRLGGTSNKNKNKNKFKKKQETEMETTENTLLIEKLSALASAALERGYTDIYVTKRDGLLQEIGKMVTAGKIPMNYKRQTTSIMWEYKPSANDTNIFGPFSSESMADWQAAGYFDDAVPVRKVGSKEFAPAGTIKFSDFV